MAKITEGYDEKFAPVHCTIYQLEKVFGHMFSKCGPQNNSAGHPLPGATTYSTHDKALKGAYKVTQENCKKPLAPHRINTLKEGI